MKRRYDGNLFVKVKAYDVCCCACRRGGDFRVRESGDVSLSGSSRLASRPKTAFTEKNEEEEQLREESALVCARVIEKRRKN